jgi:hypothetical protein
MASDIKLNENTVIVEGNIGVGTSSPIRMLHVEGSEIHSGGPAGGFSFADRTKGNAERWVLYAQDGRLHLWSQAVGRNILSVGSIDGSGFLNIDGRLNAELSGPIKGTDSILFGTPYACAIP